jgi:hypothetical protein
MWCLLLSVSISHDSTNESDNANTNDIEQTNHHN